MILEGSGWGVVQSLTKICLLLTSFVFGEIVEVVSHHFLTRLEPYASSTLHCFFRRIPPQMLSSTYPT